MFASAIGYRVSLASVLYVFQRPAFRSAADVGAGPIAVVSAVTAAAKLAAFGFWWSSPRYSSTLPLMARLIRRNVAGVSKLPFNVKPGGTLHGNSAPPAARNVAALSSVAEIEAS